MYDDALRELDMIGEEDRDSNLAVKARWQVYRDSDDSFMAEKTSRVMVKRYPIYLGGFIKLTLPFATKGRRPLTN